jgi:hypothetical protein
VVRTARSALNVPRTDDVRGRGARFRIEHGGLVLSWKLRVRDLLLAGGTLTTATVVACTQGADSASGCCNANPDPCCPVRACGAPVTEACQCQQGGGTWNYNAGPGGVCEHSQDAGPADVSQCCNANPDPCCPSQYCGKPISSACSCQVNGGTWDYGAADGGGACVLPADGGADSGDAGVDAPEHDTGTDAPVHD